jgi:predicted nucleic acid-binding protein
LTAQGIIVDTYAWLEMMKGSSKGAHARSVIREAQEIYLSVLTLYELQYRIVQIKNGESATAILGQITSQAEVIPVNRQIALLGGKIKLQQKSQKTDMGAVDCLILATAQIYNLKVLTGDPHFGECTETILI